MNFVFRLLGSLVARRIEQASLAVAAFGALAGAALGVALVWAANHLRDEPLLVHPVTAGILGAFVGTFVAPAVFRPARRATERPTRPRGALGAVRVTNLNAALGHILTSGIVCLSLGGLLYFALVERAGWSQALAITAGAAVFLVGTGALSALPVLWVDVADRFVTVRKLFSSRTASREDVRQLGFAATGSGVVPFVVEFADGTSVEVPVGPAKAAELEAVLQREWGKEMAGK